MPLKKSRDKPRPMFVSAHDKLWASRLYGDGQAPVTSEEQMSEADETALTAAIEASMNEATKDFGWSQHNVSTWKTYWDAMIKKRSGLDLSRVDAAQCFFGQCGECVRCRNGGPV